jgi:hypothetical protein
LTCKLDAQANKTVERTPKELTGSDSLFMTQEAATMFLNQQTILASWTLKIQDTLHIIICKTTHYSGNPKMKSWHFLIFDFWGNICQRPAKKPNYNTIMQFIAAYQLNSGGG